MQGLRRSGWIVGFALGLVAALPLALLAETYSVPHQFTAAEPAKAREVNENFAALVTAVNQLDAKLEALTTRVAVVEARGNGTGEPVTAELRGRSTIDGKYQDYVVPAGKVLFVHIAHRSDDQGGTKPLSVDGQPIWAATDDQTIVFPMPLVAKPGAVCRLEGGNQLFRIALNGLLRDAD